GDGIAGQDARRGRVGVVGYGGVRLRRAKPPGASAHDIDIGRSDHRADDSSNDGSAPSSPGSGAASAYVPSFPEMPSSTDESAPPAGSRRHGQGPDSHVHVAGRV